MFCILDPGLHHHHHHRLTSFFRATARVRRFPRMPLLHTARFCVSSTLSFNFYMSSSTHSRHVFLGLPQPLPFTLSTTICLHADTQSSGCLRSTCPNHLSLPRLTTTETQSMSSQLNSSALAFLSPHIHLIIILSVFLVFAYPLPSLPRLAAIYHYALNTSLI